ncbi:UNVERIFIED_CONTAM: hypothetical protein FKN15_053817 [Acipenser sinensis]
MICVQSGVYIGGASDLTDCQYLTDAAITHILTVDSEEPEVQGSFQRKFIYALDESSTDLLSILDDCVQFIIEALTTTPAAVLVHCHAGVSRSAAVVTAFMMKTHSLTLSDAYAKLQNIKPDVKIIEEFLDQLELYETMGCKVDETSPVYKQYRLRKVTEKYPELKNLPREVFAADPTSPGQTQSSEAICRRSLFRSSSILSHTSGTGPAAFAHKKFSHLTAVGGDQSQCTSHFIEPVQWMELGISPELKNLPREVFAADPTSPGQTQSSEAICRRSLFRSSSILSHTSGTGPAAFAHKKFSHLTAVGGDQSQCTSHFIEPVQWMEQALLGVMDGQLLCPKCSSKLGSFNWFGEQCSCGRWVTPAFQIHKNRVDEIKRLQIPGLRPGNS